MELNVISVILWILSFVFQCISFEFGGSSNSFAKYPAWVPCQNGSVSFEFKTLNPNALLFFSYNGGTSYYELKLVNGIMHLRFKLRIDDSPHMLSAGHRLSDGRWHNVTVTRNGRSTSLKVDNITFIRDLRVRDFDQDLETSDSSSENYAFVGGLPLQYTSRLSELPLASVIFEPRLKGSVQNLYFSNCGKPRVIPELLDSGELVLENDRCHVENPCLNEGICITRDNNEIECDCTWTNFEGDHCEIEKEPIEVTFRGAQYLTYDLTTRGDPIFSNKDELSLYFRTQQSDGLLFFTGEGKDYMTVYLKNGAVAVTVDLGSGPYNTVVDLNGYKLDDNQWHHLLVNRDSRQIQVQMDGVDVTRGTTTGDFKMLSSNVLYLGGSANTARLPGSTVKSNFKGCMKQIVYKADSIELNLADLAEADHDLISVVGDVLFGKCRDIIESRPITFTTPESFILLPRWDVRSQSGTIAFEFQTIESNGLIMYNSGDYGSEKVDFFAIEILDSYLYLILNLGSGSTKVKASRTQVDDGNPHSVYFQFMGRTGYINVDGHRTEYECPGPAGNLDLADALYIGGLNFERHNAYRLQKEIWTGMLGYGYVGCFQDLVVNNNKVDLLTVAKRQLQTDIGDYCHTRERQCLTQPCMHQGICHEGWNRFICDCRGTPYTGNTCQTVAPTLMFDGVQYVQVSLPEESQTEAEDISVRFRTIRANGVLLITSSDTSMDMIELFLEGGAVKLTINIGTVSKMLLVGRALNDDQWHTVFVKRRGQEVELSIDNERPVQDTTNEEYALDFSELAVGSRPQSDNTLQHHTGFVGAMQQFIFNGRKFFEMAKSDNLENIMVTAKFDEGESITRDPVTFKSASAYVTLPQLQANKHFAIYFKFKTMESNGLIMYNGRSEHDFLALELYGGYLFYIYDMGSGPQQIKVNTIEPLDDNKWHDVSLIRPKMEQQLIRVDDNAPTVENMEDFSSTRFDLKGPLYLGGVMKNMYNSLPSQIQSRYGFHGCIASLDLNGYQYNILRDASSTESSVIEGCTGSDVMCHPGACYHGGRCVQQWNSYICDCDMTSFTGATCEKESVSYKFGLNRGMITLELPEDQRRNTNNDFLALGFKTIQPYAVLLRVDSSDSNDYIEMELTKGNIFVVYNMGTADHPIGELHRKVNDGKYHVIRFLRSGPNATLQVDNWNKAIKTPIGKQMSVFNSQSRVWVGGRKDQEGNINNPFSGTVSGLVFNGYRILDMASIGDARVTVEGDVSMMEPEQRPLDVQTRLELDPHDEMQSTQGLKIRSGYVDNSSKKQTRYSGLHNVQSDAGYVMCDDSSSKNTIRKSNGHTTRSDGKTEHTVGEEDSKVTIGDGKSLLSNSLKSVLKYNKEGMYQPAIKVVGNDVRNSVESSEYDSTVDHIEDRDHVLEGSFDPALDLDDRLSEIDNGDTFQDYSGDDLYGSGHSLPTFEDMEEIVFRRSKQIGNFEDQGHRDSFRHSSNLFPEWTRLSRTPLVAVRDTRYEYIPKRFEKDPLDERFQKHSIETTFPKDRGKNSKRGKRRRKHKSRRIHSSSTTPKLTTTDDIISSGVGCIPSDDEDAEECIPSVETTTDDIITPVITIKKTQTPTPITGEESLSTLCTDDPNCPMNTEFSIDGASTVTANDRENKSVVKPGGGEATPGEPGKTQNEPKKDELNIWIIVGVAAAVLVALIILVIALYKFRSREEGTYKVDESQNFACLENKKPQSNGSALLGNNGSTGRVGKKKDVKEWYV